MTTPKIYEGGCLCGDIRFVATMTAALSALKPHTCSCTLCQRHSGALTVAWVEFPSADVAWTGPGGAPATWRSSAWSGRAFCKNCGSTIGAIDDKPVIALVLGVFDTPNRKELVSTSHAYVTKRPKWWHVSCD
jgi:hypothetical protein